MSVDVLEPVALLDRDIIKALKSGALKMTRGDVRYVVDLYYQMQEFRKAAANQVRAASETPEPNSLTSYVTEQMHTLERQIVRAMDAWTDADLMGQWSKSIYGIGPIISAGLSAHIDIEKAPTVGHIWSFAGLNPNVKWEKGQKRPWNAKLKTLCWKIGDSFVKFSGKDECFYGKLYRERKEQEVERNLSGRNAPCAKETLELKKFKDKATREKYEAGFLPDGRVDLRARRWVVKIFLAHWHGEAYRRILGKEPPLPYPIAHLGHVHEIKAEAIESAVAAERIEAREIPVHSE